jgi:F-type H+-transporting ATPase subunit gamma
MRRQLPAKRKLGAIVFGSDQSMCGQLNDQVVAYATRALSKLARRHPDRMIVAVGVRAAGQLEAFGRVVEKCIEVPGSVGIGAAVEEALRIVEDWHFSRNVAFVLFYAHPVSGAWYGVSGVRMLRVDGFPSERVPRFRAVCPALPSARAVARGVHSQISLRRAFAESLASENASRLASMQVAERNIEERLHGLVNESRQLRQTTITSELLDIIASYEALRERRAG